MYTVIHLNDKSGQKCEESQNFLKIIFVRVCEQMQILRWSCLPSSSGVLFEFVKFYPNLSNFYSNLSIFYSKLSEFYLNLSIISPFRSRQVQISLGTKTKMLKKIFQTFQTTTTKLALAYHIVTFSLLFLVFSLSRPQALSLGQ